MPTPFLHPFCSPRHERFICLDRGEGALVWDTDGREYVDGLASLWYCQIGHGRREMADAISAQVRRLEAFHTFAPYTNAPAESLAAAVVARSPMPDGRVFLTSSGSEAIDSAIKLVRLAFRLAGQPQRDIVIARSSGYHGVTYGGTSAQGIPPNREGFGDLVPGIVHVPHHDVAALEAMFDQHPGRVAAVLSEPVQAAGGVHPPSRGYLESTRRLCDANGALLIHDEVVCGFGRLGSWFASETFGVTPDLITFAKGVSSGYLPLGGVIASAGFCAMLDALGDGLLRHGFTYSGHPTTCAAGLESIAIIEREGLLERAKTVGHRLEQGLRSIASDDRVLEVRGAGAVWGVALRDHVDASAVRDAMLEHGVIARPLPGNTIALCPPLVITDAQIDRCHEALSAAIAAANSTPDPARPAPPEGPR